jgi:outer membrane protein OmpA-like peptidoglycan-associated protein
VLDPSQNETLNGAIARRGKGHISIEGHGDAQADTPEAQQAAVDLAVKRAQAIADWFRSKFIPADALRLSATAFGRGASVSDTP